MEKILGAEEFKKLRRGWDYPIPNGESLKTVYDRTVPFFFEKILPLVLEGKNVLVVAHGNSLRSLLKYIENISDQDIADTEFPFGAVMIYTLDENGHKLGKEVQDIIRNLPKERTSRAQIIATIGPASAKKEVLKQMIEKIVP